MAADNATLTNEVAALKSELEKFKEEVRVAARLYDEQDYYILVN